jgi:hypothetical protein
MVSVLSAQDEPPLGRRKRRDRGTSFEAQPTGCRTRLSSRDCETPANHRLDNRTLLRACPAKEKAMKAAYIKFAVLAVVALTATTVSAAAGMGHRGTPSDKSRAMRLCLSVKRATLRHPLLKNGLCPRGERLVVVASNRSKPARGVRGARGSRGYTGARGNAGSHGQQGAAGATGAPGAAGQRGAPGISGVLAVTPIPTRSADASSPCQAGGWTFSTTSGDVSFCNGQQGDTGTQGAKGDTGAQGDIGAQGGTGAQGAKGDTGTQGAKGDTGPQGDTCNQDATADPGEE